MDTRRLFHREDLQYYQDWIRKVSGRKSFRIIPVSVDMMVRAFAVRRVWKGGSDEDSIRPVRDYFKYGCAWAVRRNILLNVGYIEWLGYTTAHLRATLLHEAGHLIIPRDGHGVSGKEYVAHVYALRKASRLGLEEELQLLRQGGWMWCYDAVGVYARPYKIAYRMLKRIGVY